MDQRWARAPLADLLVAGGLAVLLGWGWIHRGDAALDSRRWPGYLFGLVGSLMMAAVLGFSWRKRVARGSGSVGGWYAAHEALGLFGAGAVLIHARYAWGAINSNVALVLTGLVVASGLVARYLLAPARRIGGAAAAVAGAWHLLHLPLYAVLVLAVLLHVYMAHAY